MIVVGGESCRGKRRMRAGRANNPSDISSLLRRLNVAQLVIRVTYIESSLSLPTFPFLYKFVTHSYIEFARYEVNGMSLDNCRITICEDICRDPRGRKRVKLYCLIQKVVWVLYLYISNLCGCLHILQFFSSTTSITDIRYSFFALLKLILFFVQWLKE
jgi:hypothetical protein